MAYFLAPQAASDLDEIWYYLARESGRTDLADKLIDAGTRRCHMLARNPHMGRARDDLRPGLRGFAIDDYIILYRLQDEDVLILRVVHGRRDIANLTQRDD